MIVLPKYINDRYNLIVNVLKSHKDNISKTAQTLQIYINTVKSARNWFQEGSPHKEQQGRPTKLNYQKSISFVLLLFNFQKLLVLI